MGLEAESLMWIPDFILNMFGRRLADKLKLTEGYMPTKPWYKSKTILASIVTGLIGIYTSLIANGVHLPSIPAWIVTILSAIGIYGRITATTTIGSPPTN